MLQNTLLPPLLQYIVDEGLRSHGEGQETKLPATDTLAERLGISRAKLREELLAAEACGVVEMRPGDGTYVLPSGFYIPIRTLVVYSVALDRKNFYWYHELRTCLEPAVWEDAVAGLSTDEREELLRIVDRAQRRLRGQPPEIPYGEHRDFHLLTIARLDNEFVRGLLRAYWDAYEAVGLHLYFDYAYYEQMWSSHKAIAEAIAAGQYGKGKEHLVQHYRSAGDL